LDVIIPGLEPRWPLIPVFALPTFVEPVLPPELIFIGGLGARRGALGRSLAFVEQLDDEGFMV
jgi:hypothetical protein